MAVDKRSAGAVAMLAVLAAWASSARLGAPPAATRAGGSAAHAAHADDAAHTHAGILMTVMFAMKAPTVEAFEPLPGEAAPRVRVSFALSNVSDVAAVLQIKPDGVRHNLLDMRTFLRNTAKLTAYLRDTVTPDASGRPPLYLSQAVAASGAWLMGAPDGCAGSVDELIAASLRPGGVGGGAADDSGNPAAPLVSPETLSYASPPVMLLSEASSPLVAVADWLGTDLSVDPVSGEEVATLTLQLVQAPGPLVSELEHHLPQVGLPAHPQRHQHFFTPPGTVFDAVAFAERMAATHKGRPPALHAFSKGSCVGPCCVSLTNVTATPNPVPAGQPIVLSAVARTTNGTQVDTKFILETIPFDIKGPNVTCVPANLSVLSSPAPNFLSSISCTFANPSNTSVSLIGRGAFGCSSSENTVKNVLTITVNAPLPPPPCPLPAGSYNNTCKLCKAKCDGASKILSCRRCKCSCKACRTLKGGAKAAAFAARGKGGGDDGGKCDCTAIEKLDVSTCGARDIKFVKCGGVVPTSQGALACPL